MMNTAVKSQENTNKAHVRPVLAAPLMKAPTIDGVIADGEWNTLYLGRFVSQIGDVLSARSGGYLLGSDGQHLFIALRTVVHPVAGVLASQEPRGSVDIGEVIYDDSIELWIDNDPAGKRADGEYFQIMINSRGALYDASFTKRDKIAQKFWRVGMQQAHAVKDGMWTAEFSIPLQQLGIKKAEDPLGIRIARNWKLPWDQARSEPMVHGFDSSDTMSTLRFTDNAPIVK